MSEQVERKLIKILGHPTESPYGNPIPGLQELGVAETSDQSTAIPVTKLLEGSDEVVATIRRLAEPAQVDPQMLVLLGSASVVPGNQARFTKKGDYVRVQADDAKEAIELHADFAAFVFVEA